MKATDQFALCWFGGWIGGGLEDNYLIQIVNKTVDGLVEGGCCGVGVDKVIAVVAVDGKKQKQTCNGNWNRLQQHERRSTADELSEPNLVRHSWFYLILSEPTQLGLSVV